jgi:hypothetical protein
MNSSSRVSLENEGQYFEPQYFIGDGYAHVKELIADVSFVAVVATYDHSVYRITGMTKAEYDRWFRSLRSTPYHFSISYLVEGDQRLPHANICTLEQHAREQHTMIFVASGDVLRVYYL